MICPNCRDPESVRDRASWGEHYCTSDGRRIDPARISLVHVDGLTQAWDWQTDEFLGNTRTAID
jgi:hypothetical protein